MAVSAVGSGHTHHSHSASSADQNKAGESLEQLAAEGDPIAMAELKKEQAQENPSATPQVGGQEPGKGGSVDKYG